MVFTAFHVRTLRRRQVAETQSSANIRILVISMGLVRNSTMSTLR